jgi:DNA-binding response OmpR family regulator
VRNPPRILVVDDNPTNIKILQTRLARNGYDIIVAGDGVEALAAAREQLPDLILLDIMMPKLDGLEVCRQLRATSAVPIIMLTARDDELDKVVGLELGADDYITKPFSIREFRSRVRALLRRASLNEVDGRDVVSADGLSLDLAKRTVELDGRRIELTYVEFELLRTLAAKPGRVYSRQALLQSLWGDHAYRELRTIDVHVRHLREKLGDSALIQTVRGVGYRFRG